MNLVILEGNYTEVAFPKSYHFVTVSNDFQLQYKVIYFILFYFILFYFILFYFIVQLIRKYKILTFIVEVINVLNHPITSVCRPYFFKSMQLVSFLDLHAS